MKLLKTITIVLNLAALFWSLDRIYKMSPVKVDAIKFPKIKFQNADDAVQTILKKNKSRVKNKVKRSALLSEEEIDIATDWLVLKKNEKHFLYEDLIKKLHQSLKSDEALTFAKKVLLKPNFVMKVFAQKQRDIQGMALEVLKKNIDDGDTSSMQDFLDTMSRLISIDIDTKRAQLQQQNFDELAQHMARRLEGLAMTSTMSRTK